jgi:hypothetical protein
MADSSPKGQEICSEVATTIDLGERSPISPVPILLCQPDFGHPLASFEQFQCGIARCRSIRHPLEIILPGAPYEGNRSILVYEDLSAIRLSFLFSGDWKAHATDNYCLRACLGFCDSIAPLRSQANGRNQNFLYATTFPAVPG